MNSQQPPSTYRSDASMGVITKLFAKHSNISPSGVLKACAEDFIVHEIGQDGCIAGIHVPQIAEYSKEADGCDQGMLGSKDPPINTNTCTPAKTELSDAEKDHIQLLKDSFGTHALETVLQLCSKKTPSHRDRESKLGGATPKAGFALETSTQEKLSELPRTGIMNIKTPSSYEQRTTHESARSCKILFSTVNLYILW